MSEIAVRCACGTVRGVVSVVAERGNRIVCYCDDCQAFAVYLAQLGNKADVLDANGGTDIYQTSPSQLRITQGAEQLRCTRLSPKGLYRWTAGCCNSAVANTLASPGVPFVGIVHTFFDTTSRGGSLDDVLGRPVARIMARFARGTPPADAHPKAPLGFILSVAKQLALGKLAGRNKPSPFFDPQTGRPLVEPRVLPLEQRRALTPKLGAVV